MFPFFAFGALHHALAVAVVAFFVLFAASKAEGFVRIFGNVLGWLLLVLVVVILACGIATIFGVHPFGGWGMGGMPHWGHMGPPMPPPGK